MAHRDGKRPTARIQLQSGRDHNLYRPLLQAYVLGLVSSTTPRIVNVLLSLTKKPPTIANAIKQVGRILQHHSGPTSFAVSCSILIGGATIVPKLVLDLVSHLWPLGFTTVRSTKVTVLRFISTFIAALISFILLNSRAQAEQRFDKPYPIQISAPLKNQPSLEQDSNFKISNVTFGVHNDLRGETPNSQIILAGRTLDLTLFGFVRAADIGISSAWSLLKTSYVDKRCSPRAVSYIERAAIPSVFIMSSFTIMWAWFYAPHRLPRSYLRWISSVAQVDSRLIQALRECRYGTFIYGKDTNMASLLGSMCRDLNLPEIWGNPAATVPIPCQLVHGGDGRSCEWHAIVRFMKAWRVVMQMCLPLNLIMLLRRNPRKRSLLYAFTEASRTSAFLGLFVALLHYGVCLARSRIGPKLFSRDTISPMMWDGGLCVGVGCMTCGWSVLLEKKPRQEEITFFTAPRALATIMPRRYDRKHLWREQLVFATSAAVILTTAHSNPGRIRGVFGKLLAQVLQ